jgi:cytochrome c-type biogenesis protein CcmE
MKTKYIIIGIIALGFLVLAYFSFDSSKIDYSDFDAAKESQKTVQIIGKLDKKNPIDYRSEANVLTFTLIDELNTSEFVTFNGPKPNNFDLAPMVVVKGRYESGKFIAKEIMTKCPSKYEGSFEDMKKKQGEI